MASGAYWKDLTAQRLSRRRALGASAGLAGGLLVLSLSGCGGGSDSGDAKKEETAKGPVDRSGLLYTPVDSTDKAKPGGTLKHFATSDVNSMDPLSSNTIATLNNVSYFAYPRLLRFNLGKYPKDADGSSSGELAESYEISPDGLTMTFKLRQGVKWDSRAPTNGRVIDPQDVLFSFNKFAKSSPIGPALAYDAQKAPGGIVESANSPDARTVVFKLKAPDSSIVPFLSTGDTMYIMPRESDGGFDPRNTVRGAGPWHLDEYVPSSRLVWKKNPDYVVKGRPYPDRIEVPIVSDYSQRLAQFRSGAIYTDVVAQGQQDAVQLKKDVPDTRMIQDAFPTSVGQTIWFGYEGNSPFKDIRLRQALSMAVDREAFTDVYDNRDNFKKAGLDLPVAANTVVGAGWTGFWLDPMGNDFGPTAKYLKYDAAEAKKLMAAAGSASGPEFNFTFLKETQFGAAYARGVELYNAMFLSAGFKPKQTGITFQEFADIYNRPYNNRWADMVTFPERPFSSVPALLYGITHSKGSVFRGSSPDGKDGTQGDPKINQLAEKIRGEFDRSKQQALVQELVKYFTGQVYNVPKPHAVKAYNIYWPVIGNLGAFNTYATGNRWAQDYLDWWIDETKPPLGKS